MVGKWHWSSNTDSVLKAEKSTHCSAEQIRLYFHDFWIPGCFILLIFFSSAFLVRVNIVFLILF